MKMIKSISKTQYNYQCTHFEMAMKDIINTFTNFTLKKPFKNYP